MSKSKHVNVFLGYHLGKDNDNYTDGSYQKAVDIKKTLENQGYTVFLRDPKDKTVTFTKTADIAEQSDSFLFVANKHILNKCKDVKTCRGKKTVKKLDDDSWISNEIDGFLRQYEGKPSSARGHIQCFCEDESLTDEQIQGLHGVFNGMVIIRKENEIWEWLEQDLKDIMASEKPDLESTYDKLNTDKILDMVSKNYGLIYELGKRYYLGNGIDRDYSKAYSIFKALGLLGYIKAQSSLGDCYCFGRGIEQNFNKAIEWYKKPAEQGLAHAQCNLGYCYENGKNVEQDNKKAVYWYKKSAEQGLAIAQYNLGNCYRDGIGIEQDNKKAVYWYKKSAEQGLAHAQYNLGNCYRDGIGVEQDNKKAVYWYMKSAEQGLAHAQFNLGYCYENGKGVEQDYKQAVYWYMKSAEQGYAYAQFNLGICYENGEGVEQDYKKALEWYRKSAEQGDEVAIKAVERLEKKLKE